MNNYKKTERLLENYRALKGYVEMKGKELEEIEYQGISAMELGEKTSKTYKINDPVFEEVASMDQCKEKIKQEIEKKDRVVRKIDFALSKLDDTQRKIIELKYIKGKQWWEIGAEVCYSERWCKHLRTKAINKMAIIIYGNSSLLLPATEDIM